VGVVLACVMMWGLGILSMQSSLFGEGGNVYNMQPGGPRPGMHGTWRHDSGFEGCVQFWCFAFWFGFGG
jgi:hypothetical protein